MTLTTGMRVGKFEILGPIGAGGMGEVWRARDTTLNRDVALKALGQAFVSDPERVSRFEREAKVLASLNHPQIASIYGLTESDGETYIELELIDGQTVNEFLAGGPPKLADALNIALQIAEALEAAHAKGIVHRDLKPANIMITPQRRIKVLDFGLAKPLWVESRQSSGAPAATASMTRDGAVVGTPAYMSPEQARGRHVDQQTDIWAFGCILFELLTGFSPFARGSVTETLAKVLEREPDLDTLPKDTPTPVRRLIRRCLEKEPENRLHHIADARLELREALSPPAAAEIPPPAARRTRWAWAGATLALAIVAAAAAWTAANRSANEPSGDFAVYAVGPPRDAPIYISGNRLVAISQDGSRIAYDTREGVYLQTLGRQDARFFAPSGGGSQFFSPDGTWLALGTADEFVAKMSIVDGVPIRLARLPPGRFMGGSWHGDSIVAASQTGLYLIDANAENGEARLVAAANSDRTYAWPSFLPDGRHVLVTLLTGDSIADASIAVLDLESGSTGAVLVRGAVGARFVAATSGTAGHLIYASGDGELLSRAYDPLSGQLASTPEALPAINVSVNGSYLGATFDVSAGGTLIYMAPQPQAPAANRLVWIDPSGGREIVDARLPGLAGYPRVSPGGDRIAFNSGSVTRRIWMLDLNRGFATQLSDRRDDDPISEDFQPVWSLDGSRIYFTSVRTGPFQIWYHAADGSGVDQQLVDDPEIRIPYAATHDNRLLVMRKPVQEADIGILGLDDPTQVEWLQDTPASEFTPALSPDDRWLAYASNEGGDSYEIYIQAFPSGRGKTRVSPNLGAHPAFATDGSGELYYIGLTAAGESAFIAVNIQDMDGLPVPGSTRIIFQSDSLTTFTQATSLRPYDVSPLDGRILIPEGDPGARNLQSIFVATNWLDAE